MFQIIYILFCIIFFNFNQLSFSTEDDVKDPEVHALGRGFYLTKIIHEKTWTLDHRDSVGPSDLTIVNYKMKCSGKSCSQGIHTLDAYPVEKITSDAHEKIQGTILEEYFDLENMDIMRDFISYVFIGANDNNKVSVLTGCIYDVESLFEAIVLKLCNNHHNPMTSKKIVFSFLTNVQRNDFYYFKKRILKNVTKLNDFYKVDCRFHYLRQETVFETVKLGVAPSLRHKEPYIRDIFFAYFGHATEEGWACLNQKKMNRISKKASHMVILQDTCHAGELFDVGYMVNLDEKRCYKKKQINHFYPENTIILSASRKKERAFSCNSFQGKKGGCFTQTFIEELGDEKKFDFSSFEKVCKRVSDQEEQHPVLETNFAPDVTGWKGFDQRFSKIMSTFFYSL